MPKIVKRILILGCLITVLILPYFVFAEESTAPATPTVSIPATLKKLIEVGHSKGPYGTVTDISTIVKAVISAVLGLLGIVFLALIVFAGYNWMIAAGDEEKVTKAKSGLA